MPKYLVFDLETSRVVPVGDDLQAHRPLGICCWAVAWTSELFGTTQTGSGYGIEESEKQPRMSAAECRELVAYLSNMVNERGYTLLGHNIVGFDLDILAEESGMVAECAELAMNSVDTCLHIHCLKGFPVGLDAICRGMGLQGKTEGINGALAPKLWAEGKHEEVLAYVAQDVRSTLEVALAVEARGGLSWIAKSGRRNHLPIARWLPVFECLQIPEPDTSWMTEPIPRSRFTSWMHAPTHVGAANPFD